MIPQQLKITNFLSYRQPQVIDFDVINLACISGQNGAGKSSILEAMTWALFGKGRARSDDDLINRHAANNDERAEVRFRFQHEANTYRVIRRKRLGKPLRLEFQVLQADGAWRTLSESSVRNTQQTIENTLKMGYETFTNISFFLQGQADEFTTKTPALRKQILADLLGIAQWDELKEQATEARKGAESDLVLLDHRVNDIDAELTEQETREAALAAERAREEQIQAQLAQQTQLLETLRTASERARRQRREVEQQEARLAREQQRLEELNERHTRQQNQLESFRALIERQSEITQNQQRFEQLTAALELWQQKQEQVSRLQQQMRPHELTIERTRSGLQQQQQELQRQQRRVIDSQAEQARIEAERARQQDRLADMQQQLEQIVQDEQRYYASRDKLQQIQAARGLAEQEANTLRLQAAEAARAANERARISASLAASAVELERLEESVSQVQSQRVTLTELRTERHSVITSEKPRLKGLLEEVDERLQRLQQESSDTCPLCGQPLSAEHREQVISDLGREKRRLNEDYLYLKQRISDLSSKTQQLELRLKGAEDIDNAREQQRTLIAQYNARIAALVQSEEQWQASGGEQRLATLNSELIDDDELQRLDRQVTQLARQIGAKRSVEQKLTDAQRRLSAAEARLAELQRLIDEWHGSGKPALEQLVAQLAADEFEADARERLLQLQQEADAIGYDEQPHQSTRAQRQQLGGAPQQFQRLSEAIAASTPLQEAIADNQQQITQQQQQIDETRQHVEDARAQQKAYEADAADLRVVEEAVQQLREQQVTANRKVGVAQQRVLVLDDLRSKRDELMAERERLTRRIARLQLLETSCGRDGVQALLIESALPEIEDSANALLDRLTNGEMRIGFETQKRLKTSDKVRETLDIRIVDRSGERPYENYSGGEQFRINFAVRLALSKLLSHRAGARLQTLVIDEGFGSQDPNGRMRLVEAINTVKDDFECVLVITHIDDLMEEFPTRIEVEKSAYGSQIRVVNQ